MASILKAALLGLAVSAAAVCSAEASAPFNPETRQIRAPSATRETPVLARYARSSASMNDASWDDDDERPRARSRKATRQEQRKAPRQRAAYVAKQQSWDDDEDRPARRGGTVQRNRAERGERSSGYVSGGGDTGIASYYWQGQRVASGGWFNPDGLTAAHRTLPFGTKVRVTNLRNGRSVNVTINDRGPFIGGRIIDLSRGAANVIGMTGQGLAQVRMEVIGR